MTARLSPPPHAYVVAARAGVHAWARTASSSRVVVPGGGAAPVAPLHGGAGRRRHGDAVVLGVDLHDRRRRRAGRERLEDGGDGRGAGVVGDEQVLGGTWRRAEARAWPPQGDGVAGPGAGRPRCGVPAAVGRRLVIGAVQHEQQVELVRLRTPPAHRVVRPDGPLGLGQLPVAVPGERLVDRQRRPSGRRGQHVDELIGPRGDERRQIAAAEGDLADVASHGFGPYDARDEGADGRQLGVLLLDRAQLDETQLAAGPGGEGDGLPAQVTDVGHAGGIRHPDAAGRGPRAGDDGELDPGGVDGDDLGVDRRR